MLRRCRLITRDPNLASDAFQAAYIELIEHGSSFRKIQGKLRWLYAVCDRSCFDLLKKRTDDQNHDYVLDVLDESENIDVRMEHRQSVTSFWNDLNDQEKKIAIMKYVDRLSLGEISDAVGLSLPTIDSKIQRIKDKAEMRSEGALDD